MDARASTFGKTMETAMNTPSGATWLVRAEDQLLRRELIAGRDFDLFYAPNLLSDHLPMATTALRRLGASDAEVLGFRARYAMRLEQPRYPDVPLSGDPWLNGRGHLRAYPALRRHIDGELRQHGREVVLRAWIPRLIGSAGVDAFHALIRTALAVESGVDEELACGLAYWIAAWRDMPVIDGPRADLSATEAFERLRSDPAFDTMVTWTGMFGDQLERLSAMPAFQALIRWRGPRITLESLARESARIYLSTGLFFALHMVTGTQAVHQLTPWAGDADTVADVLWLNLAAAYLIIRRPTYDAATPATAGLPERNAVLAAALQHDDEHIAKLAFSAAGEWAHWQQPEHAEILHRIVRGEARLGF